jgi:hypothetical protein
MLKLSKPTIYPSLESKKEKIRLEEEFKTRIPYTIEKEEIPKDAHEFYTDFGLLAHPRTGEPVQRLTDYQYDIWNCPAKTVLVDKSQKTGITTSELIHDFQELLLNGKGKDLLIVGQTEKAAIEHLYTLKRLIIDSPKYRKYLITKSSELFFREEQTKVGTLYIKNPDNAYRPMRIIGLGFIVSALWSWKNVFRIHMSDPAAAQVVDDSGIYAALMSRLTNTDGRMMIEGPPRGPQGRFYELYEQFKDNEEKNFQVFLVTIYDAKKEGLVTQEFIDKAKLELGVLFPQTYEGSFMAAHGGIFLPTEIQAVTSRIEHGYNSACTTSIGVDPAFGSSKFAICVLQLEDGIIKVIHTEEKEHADYHDMLSLVAKLRYIYKPNKVFVDAANPEFVRSLKVQFNENTDYESVIAQAHKEKINPDHRMFVIPVSFNKEGAELLGRLRHLISKRWFSLCYTHKELIKQLYSARYSSNGNLDKTENNNTYDLLDACRLALMEFEVNRK